ncbi:hypothetical protein CFP56_005240 [Quercus suber]|uniref:Uncharacterized protein n=1 Tax=Quercus suber TaxID=58331 RepID=A0AAW0LBL2_QUESU
MIRVSKVIMRANIIREKGLTEKIKENVPGVGRKPMIRTNKVTHFNYSPRLLRGPTSSGEQGVDKKIKENVPARSHDFNYSTRFQRGPTSSGKEGVDGEDPGEASWDSLGGVDVAY